MKLMKTRKGEQVRKEIYMRPSTEVTLKILAAKAGKSFKEYVEDLLNDHAENQNIK